MAKRNHRMLIERSRREACELVRLVAEPVPNGEKIKTSIARAAESLNWPFRRTAAIWRREAHRIDAWEMDLLRAVIHNRRTKRNPKRRKI